MVGLAFETEWRANQNPWSIFKRPTKGGIMAYEWCKTQYPGVRYREHKERKHNGKPDRYFTIYYKLNGKTKEEGLGWASEDWSAEKASITLAELKKARKTGEGAVTLKEKRTLAAERRDEEARQKAQEQRDAIALRDVATEYVKWAKGNKKTWRDDETRLNMHVLPLMGDSPLVSIGAPEIESLKVKCQEKGLAPATVIQCVAVIRAVFNFASRQGMFSGVNPVKGVKLPKLDNRRVRFLSRHEANMVLEMARSYNLELHDMCLICLYTGMRAGEMMTLQRHDIDFEHNLITIRDPKNGESRQVFLTANVKGMLEERLKKNDSKTVSEASKQNDSQLVFPNKLGEERDAVSKLFKRCIDGIGMNDGITDPRQKVCFHTLRHTFASWLALQGETLLTIKELMGHKTIQMTMRYAHLIPDQKRKAVERLCGNA